MSELRIVAAAIFHGATISLPPPARHHTVLQTMSIVMGVDAIQVRPENEGLLTSDGRFVNRVEAYYIAWRAGQLKDAKQIPELYSEDLW
ncbi:hypothetical protein [Rhizobium leguminosarum]|uniref:hypothetical protein n=1 Tax=Rhizobium leguminosarum TaxID=384 RepID=UPI002E114263|nr:hypothetical protein U8Q02_42175 [Rhizobium leguminosarum]